MAGTVGFPSRLRRWRGRRGLSQLQLAMTAGCSQRHVSFVELGRTKPSREMVLRLAGALDVPLRQANELLLAAGYAPVWAETDLGAQALAPVRQALDYMLAQQEPYPAVTEAPILPMHFQKARVRLRLFTAIATLGTPQDITLQELRIESFFPVDEETRETFWKWAGSKKSRRSTQRS